MDSPGIGNRYIDQRLRVERESYTRRFAIDAVLRREVLITQLAGPIGRRAAAQESFAAEARAAMRLSHPNIVTTYDTDTENGYPFAVQEFVHSETLRSIIDAEKPFHPDDVAILVQSLADALSYARLRGMPHLAINPDCIVVDYDGTVLVSDFGIGRVLADLEPPTPDALPYIAPEAVGPNTGDARSDIYSVGAIAYEMICGEAPVRRDDGSALPLDVVAPHTPPAVARVVTMALAPYPENRFRSIEAFATALSNATEPDQIPSAHPEEPSPQFRLIDDDPEPDETVQMDVVSAEPPPVQQGRTPGRLTALLAWCALAIGVLALGWVMFSFLS
ncbi:MAG: serine/threonine protein kinase, partial [Chloroflexota bacterium]|nr:serine/threonine protein kinase [Chloroflexota bacterium]